MMHAGQMTNRKTKGTQELHDLADARTQTRRTFRTGCSLILEGNQSVITRGPSPNGVCEKE